MMDNEKGTPENSVSKTNWQICAICQEATSEALQFPADTKRSDVGAGYKNLAGNLEKFYKLGCMPTDLSLSQLDEGNGIEGTLIMRKANPNTPRRWMLSGPEWQGWLMSLRQAWYLTQAQRKTPSIMKNTEVSRSPSLKL